MANFPLWLSSGENWLICCYWYWYWSLCEQKAPLSVWICSVLSDLGSGVRGSLWTKLHSALPPLSLLPPNLLHLLLLFLVLLSSPTSFACFLSPSLLRSPFFIPLFLLSSFLSSTPPLSLLPHSYLHLLSQGPCGTLRGWWGWGWWWCRWWWNSHPVSCLPVLELEASPSLSPHLSFFLRTSLPLFKGGKEEDEE